MKYHFLIIGLVVLTLTVKAQKEGERSPEIAKMISIDSMKIEQMKNKFDGFLPAELRGDVYFLYQTLEEYIHKDKALTAGITKAENLSLKEQRQLKKAYQSLKNIANSFEQIESLLKEADELLYFFKQKQFSLTKDYEYVRGEEFHQLEKRFDQHYKAILKNTKKMWNMVILYLWKLKQFKNDDAPNLLTELLMKHKEKIKLGFEFLLDENDLNEKIDSLSQVQKALIEDAENLTKDNQDLYEKTLRLQTKNNYLSSIRKETEQENENHKKESQILNHEKLRLIQEIKNFEDSLEMHHLALLNLKKATKQQKKIIAEQNANLNHLKLEKEALSFEKIGLEEDVEIQTNKLAVLKRENNWLRLIFALALPLLVFLILFFRKKNQADTYLKELNHRVKNTLQDISALLSLQTDDVKDPDAKRALQEAINRVEAIKIVYRHLYTRKQKRLTTINLKYYIEDLVKHLMSMNTNRYNNAQAYINIEEVHVNMETGYPIGLIINELMTNSFQHAFEKVHDPKLNIGLSVEQGQMNLRVQDNGKGLPQNFSFQNPSSFGLKLVKDLVEEHKGRLIPIANPTGGTAIEISFPIT